MATEAEKDLANFLRRNQFAKIGQPFHTNLFMSGINYRAGGFDILVYIPKNESMQYFYTARETKDGWRIMAFCKNNLLPVGQILATRDNSNLTITAATVLKALGPLEERIQEETSEAWKVTGSFMMHKFPKGASEQKPAKEILDLVTPHIQVLHQHFSTKRPTNPERIAFEAAASILPASIIAPGK